ncbi:hypothetical protein JCM3774_000387 [Rhodotorula dairenensis]
MSAQQSASGTHRDPRLGQGQPDALERAQQAQATLHAMGQGMYAQPQPQQQHQVGGPQYHHPQHQHQPPPYQPMQHMPMPPYQIPSSSALQHLANTPYANYAMSAVPYAQLGHLPPPPQAPLPLPPPPPRRPASGSSAAPTPSTQPARYQAAAHPDPFNLLPLPSHQYAPIGMSYAPYPPPPPPPASVIASQPPLAASVPPSTSTRPLPPPHAYSPLPPPARRPPPPADDAEDLLPLPSAFADRRVEAAQPDARVREDVEHRDEDEDDDDLPLRLPTPPSDLANGDDDDDDDGSDYQPEAGSSGQGSRKKRNLSPLRDNLPAKRARVSVTEARKGAGNEKLQVKKRRGPNKKNKSSKRGKKDEPPPGVETTVDGSWRRKLSRGGWGGPGGTGAGSRPETFLRKLWKLMQDPTTDVSAYMHWDSSGKLLIIPDEKALVEHVCKVHFAQKSITSFNKQMNNWDFKRHSRSQRDLAIISQTEPNVTRNTRIWYHPSLVASSTLEDVQRVGRHEDGMAKKRRVKSKHTGVLEEGVGTGRGKRAKVLPPTKTGDFPTQSPAPSSSNGASTSGVKSRTEKKPRPSRASAVASGSGTGRKRPRYAESDTDDFSDTTRDDEDDDEEEDEDAEGETDEDASGSDREAKAADSDDDADGEPDDELYASQPAPVVDVKGKGKAKAIPSPAVSTATKGKRRAVSSPAAATAPTGRPRRSLPAPSASTSTDATKSPAPGPSTKRAPAAAAAKKATPDVGGSSKETKPTRKPTSRAKELIKDAQKDGEVAEEEAGSSSIASSSRRPRRSSAVAAISAQRKQLAVDSSDEEATSAASDKPVEPVALPAPPMPPSKPTRAARRRNSIVMEELSEIAPEATAAAAGYAKAQPGSKARGKSTVDDVAEDPETEQPGTPVQAGGTRRTRASRGGGAAAQAEPEQQAATPAVTESAAALVPTRRSARASGARAAREADAATEAAPAAATTVDDDGPSHGTRRASRIGKALASAFETAPDLPATVKKADEASAAPSTNSRRGRAPAAARGGRGAVAAVKRGRGRGGATAVQAAGRGGAASGSRGMRRGGAGFRAGLQPFDAASPNGPDGDVASLHFGDGANGSRTPHVYSLPRPPHLDKLGGTATSSRDASVDASAEAGPSNLARSPSPASQQFLYPDASNPYGSSPYPAYPHQTQTPVMRHQHPTLPHKVYHSEPGLARTAFYYHGVSPLPRPYIHPEHDISDDVLDNGDEASVFGSDFATDASLGMARSAGAYALAAYRNGSPAARGPTFERSFAAGRVGPLSPRFGHKWTTESQVSDLRASLDADDGGAPGHAAAGGDAALAGLASGSAGPISAGGEASGSELDRAGAIVSPTPAAGTA